MYGYYYRTPGRIYDYRWVTNPSSFLLFYDAIETEVVIL